MAHGISPDWRLSSVKALVPEAEYIAYTVADDNGIVHTYHENAADRFLVVSKDCKYPQVAVEILNILYDDLAAPPRKPRRMSSPTSTPADTTRAVPITWKSCPPTIPPFTTPSIWPSSTAR